MEVSPNPAGEGHCPEDNRYSEWGGRAGARERLHPLTLALPSDQMP